MNSPATRNSGRPDVVVITGCSAGVGRAVAQRFAKAGCRIGLVSRNEERLQQVKREVETLGAEALVYVADVADPDQVETAATTIHDHFGSIDIWINNAMASVFSPVKDMAPAEYKRVTEVTYLGTVYGTLAALKRMSPKNRGSIVQVGSALAYRGIPLQSAYCAAKHAIQGFMDSLRSELLHDKSAITVCMVQMPALNTPQFSWVKSRLPNKAQPVPPIFQPEVAAEAVYFAAYHPRREFWVGFPTAKTIFGNKIFPGLLDRYLAKVGYKAQQTGEREDPGRPDNLWQTVPGHFGAHGAFDARSRSRSWYFWMTTHRALVWGTVVVCLVLIVLLRI
jgi:NAD(P)-dependent dehydrogenase (short-subunit alcohol dehydrogenase family)